MMQWTQENLKNSLNEIFAYAEKNSKNKTERLKYNFSLWKRTSADNGIIIYGSGGMGKVIYKALRQFDIPVLCFIDSNIVKTGQYLYNIPVLLPKEAGEIYTDSLCIIAVNIPEKSKETSSIFQLLSESMIKRVIHWGFLKTYESIIGFNLTENFVLFSEDEVLKNKENIFRTAKLFEDNYSRMLFFKIIRNRIIDCNMPIDGCYSTPGTYFHDDLFKIDNEVVIDGGAYTGDTLRSFMDLYGGKFKQWNFYEAMEENSKIITAFVQTLNADLQDRVHLYRGALGNTNKPLKFFSFIDYPEGSAVIDNEKYTLNLTAEGNIHEVPSIRLDDQYYPPPPPIKEMLYPTLIKMDIEGSELDALKGAEKTIQTAKPVLAISLYHKNEHLWEIPLWIYDVMPDVHFFLRCNSPVFDHCIYAVPSNRMIKK